MNKSVANYKHRHDVHSDAIPLTCHAPRRPHLPHSAHCLTERSVLVFFIVAHLLPTLVLGIATPILPLGKGSVSAIALILQFWFSIRDFGNEEDIRQWLPISTLQNMETVKQSFKIFPILKLWVNDLIRDTNPHTRFVVLATWFCSIVWYSSTMNACYNSNLMDEPELR